MTEIKKMYLVGCGIEHSLSPVMYKAAFEALGMDGWTYEAFDFEEPKDAKEFLERKDYAAVNITTPYKTIALDAAARVETAAQHALGANLLINTQTGVWALNTDGSGCVGFLLRSGVAVADADIVVCGTGPTALAIADSLIQTGAGRVVLLSRDEKKAQTISAAFMADVLESSGECGTTTIVNGFAYGDERARDAIAQAHIIVDATTLGMNAGDPAPFDVALLQKDQVVLDTVYGHGVTELARGASAAGATFFDGTGMLTVQAVISLQHMCATLELGCDLNFNTIYTAMAKAATCNM